MSPSSKTYRIYSYNGFAHEVTADWLEASGDEDAIVKAQAAVVVGKRCEIWDGRRLVAQLQCEQRQV